MHRCVPFGCVPALMLDKYQYVVIYVFVFIVSVVV